ncbi:MAG: hypothetical protein IKJ11_10580 [Clostridia bacterium]|nr:hypothetical protein [Clostridia bacterium]
MSSFALRTAALLAMIADHAGLALFPDLALLRCIGRISFPLYCFLVVQGYLHTRDVSAYGRRLLLTAILSEIPFDLLIFGRAASPVEQNVLFSLLLGLMALYAADVWADRPVYALFICASLCLGAMALNVSYGWLGVALCLTMRNTQADRLRFTLSTGAVLLLYTLSLLLSGVAPGWALASFCSLFSLVPLLLYNGRQGLRSPAITFLFYGAYPLHLIALVVIRAMRIIPPHFF